MRQFITGIFVLLLVFTILITMVVGVTWLFDFKLDNLYLVWSFLYKSLAIFFGLHLLFGEKN